MPKPAGPVKREKLAEAMRRRLARGAKKLAAKQTRQAGPRNRWFGSRAA